MDEEEVATLPIADASSESVEPERSSSDENASRKSPEQLLPATLDQEDIRLSAEEAKLVDAEEEGHLQSHQDMEFQEEEGRGHQEGGDDACAGETESPQEPKSKGTRRVSDLVFKYIHNVSPDPSPIRHSISATNFNPEVLPKIGNIRARFEETSKAADGQGLLFGEAFRQKQRFHQLADREQKIAAQINLRGYDCL